MKTRVLINCPGGWSHGLDSPERGEGRWAQNLVKVLAKSGRYEVFACSGGTPTWGRGERVSDVTLLAERDADKLKTDIYIDASWYQGKRALGKPRVCFHAYWGVEDWMLRIPLPPNHHLIYVYRQSAPFYLVPQNVNPTHYLPAAFGPDMVRPNPSARRVLSFARQRDALTNVASFENLYSAIDRMRASEQIQFVWLDSPAYARHNHTDDCAISIPPGEPWGIPYCEQLALIRGAGLNATFIGGGSIADCAVHGVPSLIRRDAFDFIRPAAEAHNLLLQVECSSQEIEDIMRRLYGDAELYARYVSDLQELYADHTDSNVLRLFDELAAKAL